MANRSLPTPELSNAMQAFPRITLFEFSDDRTNASRPITTLRLIDAWPNAFPHGPIALESGKTQGYRVPGELGAKLTNNSLHDDGYRFHDAFHIGIMAKLGWSPVMRSLLGVKRRSSPQIDEVDDGARAIIFEESLLDFLGMSEVGNGSSIEKDTTLLLASLSVQRFMRSRTVGSDVPEQAVVQNALLDSAELFHQVRYNLGGFVVANLDNRSVLYQPK